MSHKINFPDDMRRFEAEVSDKGFCFLSVSTKECEVKIRFYDLISVKHTIESKGFFFSPNSVILHELSVLEIARVVGELVETGRIRWMEGWE